MKHYCCCHEVVVAVGDAAAAGADGGDDPLWRSGQSWPNCSQSYPAGNFQRHANANVDSEDDDADVDSERGMPHFAVR